MTRQAFGRTLLSCLCCLILAVFTEAVGAVSPADWSEESLVFDGGGPRFLGVSDAGDRVVALLVSSGDYDDADSRHIVVSERSGGAWQPPEVLATNGHYSFDSWQVGPWVTRPVISGDGETVAYLGWTGDAKGLYMVARQPGGGWRAPVHIGTGLPTLSHWLSLSRDGQTLALSDNPFWSGTQHVYVMRRTGDSWSAPQRVTPEEGLLSGGGLPSLSADGRRMAYVRNTQVIFTEWVDGGWREPVQLTEHSNSSYRAEYIQMSADGRAIFYWLVHLVPQGSSKVRVGQDLYVMRRVGDGWGAPEKVTPTPTPASSSSIDAAAPTANDTATRFVYPRRVTDPDEPGIQIEISEWQGDAWETATLLDVAEYDDYNDWPCLTPDGLTLVYKGGRRRGGQGPALVGAVWQMTTAVAPPARPLPISTAGLIGPAGGTLFSEIDQTRYTFAPGAFTETVRFTHTHQLPATAPAGLVSSGHGFVITAVTSSTHQPVQPVHPISVTVDYGATGHGVAVPGTLGLWRWDGGAWGPVAGHDDADVGLLTAYIDHFSHFGVFGETERVYLPLVVR